MIVNGWLASVERHDSPNFNARPTGVDVSALIIHNISLPPGAYGGQFITPFFLNTLDIGLHPYFAAIAHMRVSAHCLIERSGKLVQFVSFNDRAWHAGRSALGDEVECNDFAVGIELEGTDDDPYTPLQYEALISITKELMKAYPKITIDRIVGHCDVAPGRKTDPGPVFDWKYYKNSL